MTLAPVIDDLSAYVIAGAVASEQQESEYETVSRTPAQGIEDAVEAERLGFRRVWLSERIDIKQADVLCSGMAARTSRLEVGTGVIDPPTRHPWLAASFGATMQSCYGPRFNLGLGRGENGYFKGTGITQASFGEMRDYVKIMRQLWAGESVTYDGPLGRFDGMAFAETYHGPPPPVWYGGLGQPIGARLAAECFDGLLLVTMMTPEAVHDAAQRVRTECERIGRDPASVRVAALVVTAPDLDEFETHALAHSRLVTYLTYPKYGEILCDINGWDRKVLDAVRNHELFQGLSQIPDRAFQRHQMMDVAALIPDEWMQDTCGMGSVSTCVGLLQRYIDAGADEVVVYGSTPAQNRDLVAAWRDR